MKTVCFLICLMGYHFAVTQSLATKLSNALARMEKDEQFRHSVLSLYVVDSKKGTVVFDKNSEMGLAPASCQKIVTSATAFEILGGEYTYKTPVMLYRISDSQYLFITGSGDPTLGSWRWPETKMEVVCRKIVSALKERNFRALCGDIFVKNNLFVFQPVPDGWVWQDIGNYYGAGAQGFNWHENQYDLILGSGINEGDSTMINGFEPASAQIPIRNRVRTGKKGSGDNAYLYMSAYGKENYATGTIPPGQTKFVISGAMPSPMNAFKRELRATLRASGILIGEGFDPEYLPNGNPSSFDPILELSSPPLDSINFWFLKKSVNLFGEAFLKTIAKERIGLGSTDSGVAVTKRFWADKGIENSELNILDGSGLSPGNRVTTHALVTILQFAKSRYWFPSFYHALPEINGIKMKDGYINGVRSFTGYVKSGDGKEYSFSFIVNNYDGNAATVREKMWSILDILK